MEMLLYEASFSALPVQEAEGSQRKGIWNVKLIGSDIEGSSGYYPRDVLERDGPLVFPKGTQVYFDHPKESETWERPERSVRDMAGIFETGAQFLEDGAEGPGLYANVRLFSEADKWMDEAKDAIGMSIRARGTAADTDDGYTITSLNEGLSVDIVTRAGAGGKVVQLMESGRNNAPKGGGAQGADVSALATQMETLAEGQKSLNDAITSLVSTIKESAQKPEDKDGEDKGLTPAQIVTKLDEADLPAVCRQRLAEAYKPGDDFDAMVKAEKEYAKQVMEAAKPVKNTVYRGKANSAETTAGVLEESHMRNLDNELNESAKIFGLEV